jgi:putative sigma-54 modulation protein
MTVKVVVRGRDLEISPRLQEYVDKKLGKLDRYLPVITEARMDLTEEKSARSVTDRFVAQLTVPARGALLRAEERSDDVFAAVDAVLDKMQRQIERYKGKRWRSRNPGAETVEELPEDVSTLVVEPAGVVVRRKQFVLTPMNEAEAIEQMQLLGHDNFFVFYNADTNRINVLYRRRRGDFGLIDPEIG